MLAPTHITTTVLITSLPILTINNFEDISTYFVYVICASIGTSLPDNLEKILSLKHRTLTHNYIIPMILLLLFCVLNNTYIVFLLIGYLLHLITDSCSIQGIPRAFYPVSKSLNNFYLMPKNLRYKVGGNVEFIIFVVSTLLTIFLYYKVV